ncbi:MAG: ABC transporter permease [Kofleriaceae bacterium]|nr:ABC transporter permease [Kofleriaceae bacterium]
MTAPRRAGRPDWLVIARREFLERVRSPWFIVVTLLGPVLMVATIVLPALIGRTVDNSARVQVVDRSPTHQVGPAVVVALGVLKWKAELAPAPDDEIALRKRVADDQIDGFLVIPPEAPAGGTVTYQGRNAANAMAMAILAQVVTQVTQALRARAAGVPDDQLASVLAPVPFAATQPTGEAGGSSGMAVMIVGYAAMLILYMAIILYAVNVLRSVVQEKTNRVVEIMVAAAKPRALMLGKILGVGAVGLVQVAVWVGMAMLSMKYRGELLGVFGVEAGNWNVPSLRAIDVAVVLVYFVLGYFFYAAMYAAVGAMVSSDQEAQQVQTPVAMLLVVPVLCVQLVASAPRSGAARALTLVPFSSPVLMPMRWLLGGASIGELLLSMAILVASTVVVARVAAKIYRVGILMYGKRPSMRELWRWMRY